MNRNMIQNENMNEYQDKNGKDKMVKTFPIAPDQLKMWECTSMNGIKLACKIKFILEESTKEINIENNHALNEIRF